MSKLLALDSTTVRTIDKDGMLHVAVSNISKANVSPYYGREIPDYRALGLDPNKTYYLYRDPQELAKAVDTFNGKPILRKHIPFDVNDPPQDDIVGYMGTDAEFDGTYLKNSLHFHDASMIDAIESGAQRELSPGYHYRADMTPGFVNGERHDGVMRDIACNHLVPVEVGRTGPDVMVFDELPQEMKMDEKTKQRLEALKPFLAMDADIEKVAEIISKDEGESEKDKPKAKDNEPELKDEPKAEDEDPDDGKKKAEDEDDEAGKKKPAMDAAQIAMDVEQRAFNKVQKHFKDLREAEKAVFPVVGEIAMDSADEVYRYALDSMGIKNHKAMTGEPLKAMFNAVQQVSKSAKAVPVIAQDSSALKTLTDLVPNLKQ